MRISKRTLFVFLGFFAIFVIYLAYCYLISVNLQNNGQCPSGYWNETVQSGYMFGYIYLNPFANTTIYQNHANALCTQLYNANNNFSVVVGTYPLISVQPSS